ncbi:MAG: nucleotidyltransferase domain-containing protein [Eubacteriales bacterium]
MNKILKLDEKINKLSTLFSKTPEIQAVFLFGSYGTGNQTDLSDIDFAVLFDRRLDLTQEAACLANLSEFLGTDRVDLVNLNKAPLNLQFKAISEGKIIYEREYITTCDYIEKVIDLYQDYAIDLNYFYQEYDEALQEAYTNGR